MSSLIAIAIAIAHKFKFCLAIAPLTNANANAAAAPTITQMMTTATSFHHHYHCHHHHHHHHHPLLLSSSLTWRNFLLLPLPQPPSHQAAAAAAARHRHKRLRQPLFIRACFKTSSQPLTAVNDGNYNPLIQSLCRRGDLGRAVQLLRHERNPTQRTYESLILACAAAGYRRHDALPYCSLVHRHLVDNGLDQDPFLATRLIDMYSRLGRPCDARHVFDRTREKTVFVWNALLKALALADRAEEALSLLAEMGRVGMQMDSFTYSHALKACIASSSCASLASDRVRQIHGHVYGHGFESGVYVATTLVDCYGKLGYVACAERVFNGISVHNVVSWSAMIACYANNERPFHALELFREMILGYPGMVPNSITMVSVLQACAGLAAVGQGKVVHAFVLRRGLESMVAVLNSLIAMYAKCGSLETALHIFDRMHAQRDVVSWNSIISGYGIQGFGEKAVQAFHAMINSGIPPSPITFTSILGACSHAGLVSEGKKLFELMSTKHGLSPRSEHYACMVDLLGRSGKLDEAVSMIESMQIDPGPTVWGSLLGASRIHCNVDLAERACLHLFELEPRNAGNYVLLADVYAGAKMWDEVRRVKDLIEAKGLQKLPGCSWIELKKKIYSFVSVDELNPYVAQLDALLVQLVTEMKKAGYVPNTKLVLYDLDEHEKEKILLGHSEKLALAFGLINSSKGEVIRITKNLRLCEDCHTVTKFVSKFTKREILVRDVNRFHHFRDGICSCADYW